MKRNYDPMAASHPYLVAKELATPHNSLRALIMASMLKADGPALHRLISAFPEIHADLVAYSVAFKKKEGG